MSNGLRKFKAAMLGLGKPLGRREMNLMEMMRHEGNWQLVYICAPYDGKDTRSLEKIWNYCMFAKEHRYMPVAPYLYYPQFMNDFDERESRIMNQFARCDIRHCEEVWVFGKEITSEMEKILDCAQYEGLNMRCFPDWDIMLEYKDDEEDENDE